MIRFQLGIALGRPQPFKFFKGCLPQILLGPFLNNLSQILFKIKLRTLVVVVSLTFPNLRKENLTKILLGHPNINSIRNKFESIREIISNNVGICLISEIKLTETILKSQFQIDGYQSKRRDRTCFGGGL